MTICHSAIPPFCHSAIWPFRHSAIPPFCHFHSAITPFIRNLHCIMDDASMPNTRRVRPRWPCQWDNRPRWSQPGHNSMCKRHYKESLLCQSNNNELSQSNNDAQQGAIVLAALSGHVNNREINSNVCNEEATCNNVPAVSHQQNINLIIECVADNNTTGSRVEL